MTNLVLPFLAGYAASRLLYGPMHGDGFPEMGRYSAGYILCVWCARMAGVPDEHVVKALLVGGAVGAGVALARVTR